MAKNYLYELIPVVLFKGTTKREYVVTNESERDISFTNKFSEATVFRQWHADMKILNWASYKLKKIPLNE